MVTHTRWQTTKFSACIVAVSLLLIVGAAHAMTPAATLIENRAQATYPWEGETHTTWSNWVTVTVSQVAGVEIVPHSTGGIPGDAGFVPAYQQAVAPGQTVSLPYHLINRGNATDTFELGIEIHANGGALAPSLFEPVLYHDLNGDGLVNAGDPAIEQITLAAGESAALILRLYISPLAMDEEPVYAAVVAASNSDPDVFAGNTWSRLDIAAEVPIITVQRSVELEKGPLWPPGASAGTNGGTGAWSAETGDRLTHTITLDNMGYVSGTDIVLWELLAASESLVFDAYGTGYPLLVSGTPTALGTSPGDLAKLVTDAEGREGIELLVPKMESTQRVIVQYEVKVDWQPDSHEIRKVAEVTYDERPSASRKVQSNTIWVLRGQPIALRITPRGGSLAPDAPNVQNLGEALAGQKVAFEATVHNIGRTAGIVELSTIHSDVPTGWEVRFYRADGVTPLTDTNNNGTVDLGYLEAAESQDLVIVVEVPTERELFDAPPYPFEIKAHFAATPDRSDTTHLLIETVTAIEHAWDPLTLDVNPAGVTTPGAVLTYDLYFGNASSLDAYDVVIVEQLSSYLEPPSSIEGEIVPLDIVLEQLPNAQSSGLRTFASASATAFTKVTGVYDPLQHAIVWTIPHVPALEGGILSFSTRVGEGTPESAVIEVQGTLTSDVTTVVAVSNVVTNVVLTKELLVSITSEYQIVSLGDVTTLSIDVTNTNPLAAIYDVEVHVSLPPGLSYRANSSRLGGTSIADPEQHPGQLIYTVPRIEKGSSARITFAAIVNVAAENEIVVDVIAMMQTDVDEWKVSPRDSTLILVIRGILADHGTIVGRVLLDEGETGATGGPPRVVPGVRIVMDNGRFAVSDQDGRFSFSAVHPGARLLRIDPLTLSTVAVVPGGIDPAQSDTRRVIVPAGGIAMVDFVLRASELDIVSSERMMEEEND